MSGSWVEARSCKPENPWHSTVEGENRLKEIILGPASRRSGMHVPIVMPVSP